VRRAAGVLVVVSVHGRHELGAASHQQQFVGGLHRGHVLSCVAVGARRLHDIDRSGWWQLLYFFPIVGWIVLIVLWAQPGKQNGYA
jgi:hypothetical protein